MSVPIKQIGLQREAWGPRFWTILHTFAECSGSQSTQIQSNDEADAWICLVRALPFALPCALCRQHFKEWTTHKRLDHLRTITHEARRAFLREWVWGCHDRVNQMTEKTSPALETCAGLYPRRSIEKEVQELAGMFRLALDMRQLKPEDVTRWKQMLARLRVIYGI
jgi:hypothetical protein